jgi:hypothetical protein
MVYFCVVLCIVCFVSFCVLFVCKCVLCYCHRVAIHLQLRNISYHISAGVHSEIRVVTTYKRVAPWRRWLRHGTTRRKVTDLIPHFVFGIFPSGRTMVLGSTQPLTELSTRNISEGGGAGKGGRFLGATTLPPSCADCLEIWEPELPGNLRA